MNIEHSSFNFFEQFNQNGFLYNILFYENYDNSFFNSFLKESWIVNNFNDIIFSHYISILLISFLFIFFVDKNNYFIKNNEYLIKEKPVVHGWKITGNNALLNLFTRLNISFNNNNFSIWYIYVFFLISFLLNSYIDINKIYLNSFNYVIDNFSFLNENIINNYFYGYDNSEITDFVNFIKPHSFSNICNFLKESSASNEIFLKNKVIQELSYLFTSGDSSDLSLYNKNALIMHQKFMNNRSNFVNSIFLPAPRYDSVFLDNDSSLMSAASALQYYADHYHSSIGMEFLMSYLSTVNTWENAFKIMICKDFADYIQNFDISFTIVYDNVITPFDSNFAVTVKKSLNQAIPVELIMTKNTSEGVITIKKIFNYYWTYADVYSFFNIMSSYFQHNYTNDCILSISNIVTNLNLIEFQKVYTINATKPPLSDRVINYNAENLQAISNAFFLFLDRSLVNEGSIFKKYLNAVTDVNVYLLYITKNLVDTSSSSDIVMMDPLLAKVLWNKVRFEFIDLEEAAQYMVLKNYVNNHNITKISLHHYFNSVVSYNFNDFVNLNNISFKYLKLDENYVSFFFTFFVINFLNFKNHRSSFGFVIPNKLQLFNEKLFKFFLGIFSSNLGDKTESQYFFKIVYTLGLLVLFFNLEGMLHYLPTITSSLINTLYMASIIFFSIIVSMVMYNSFRYFLNLLYPSGTSFALAFLLIPIELLSYLSRIVSLSVRLFANMMAGHTLLKVISSFVINLLNLIINYYYFVIGLIIPLLLLYILTNLEIGVSLIQTYIFVILSSIYLKDIFYEH